MNKAQKAVNALNEAADAYDALPSAMKTASILGGPMINTVSIRAEANRIEARMRAMLEGMEEVDD